MPIKRKVVPRKKAKPRKKKHQAVVTTEADARLLLSHIRGVECIGFDTESSGPTLVGQDFINVYRSQMCGFSVAVPMRESITSTRPHVTEYECLSWYVPVGHTSKNLRFDWVLKILEAIEACPRVWAHNWKHDLITLQQFLKTEDWCLSGAYDSQVVCWLAGASTEFGLKHLMKAVLNEEPLDYKGTVNGKSFSQLTPVEASAYARQDAEATLALGERFLPQVPKEVVSWENRLMPVVAAMERRGIGFKVAGVLPLTERLQPQLDSIMADWGCLFPGVELSSNSQLAKALFEESNTWDKSLSERSKGGWSVSADVVKRQMQKLKPGSTGALAAEMVLEYRELAKILSTYSWNLVAIARQYPDCRLHPSYHQTGTATGRFSSSYPNGQNMPTRSKTARNVLELFCASPGNKLVSADFSQIEYRVLAHLCGGELAKSYQEGLDMHQRTGELLGMDRNAGKTMNFALVYGRGLNAVASDLNCSKQEAGAFVDKYFAAIPETKRVKAAVLQSTQSLGYSLTLTGRKRYFPEAKDRPLDHSEKRQAFNAVIQGTAADICKRAMVLAHEAGLPINCQIHDDIRLEVPEADAKDAARELSKIMESCYKLDVPLKADPVIGDNWKDLKDE